MDPNSSLRDRLERLGVTRGMPDQPEPAAEVDNADRSDGIESVIEGQLVETPGGVCFVTEEQQPVDAVHGNTTLSAIRTYNDGTLAAIARDDQLHEVDPRAAAFIDTETSGLAGGTGTYAFLVGVGFFDGPTFRVRQFFMRDPSEEPALIHLLDELLRRFQAVVTFNGKAFDLPLLNTRFTLWHRQFPLTDAPHLDLLAPSRRLWKERLPSCSLTSLEKHILGIFRENDVPGSLIPYLYFDYERTGNARPLEPVFTHNVFDILSMVSLTACMAQQFTEPEAADVVHGADWYSLGRCYEHLGWFDRAETAYRKALQQPCAPTTRHRAIENLSFLYKRQSRWNGAVEMWWDLVNARIANRLYPYVELAKYYEHQQRDYEPAMRLVREAIRRIQEWDLRPRRPRRQVLSELQHRLGRLERKQKRATQ